MRWSRRRVNIKTAHQSLTPKTYRNYGTENTNDFVSIEVSENANHDGVTQQIDDRLQVFETENTMLIQTASPHR